MVFVGNLIESFAAFGRFLGFDVKFLFAGLGVRNSFLKVFMSVVALR
jgi:hypothetical protein